MLLPMGSLLSGICRSPLTDRLASHAAATCSRSTCWGSVAASGKGFSAAAADGAATVTDAAPTPPLLTADQKRKLPMLLALLQRPGATAHRLGALASLAATQRDLSIVLSSLQLRQLDFPYPNITEDSEWTKRLRGTDRTGLQTGLLPLVDTTALGDSKTAGGAPAPPDLQLDQKYMDKVSCWMQLLPNHIEMSYPLLTSVKLFPPQEASYPTYVDFDAALRLLHHRKSRKRIKLQRRLLKKQDKYQLKTWDHYVGEA